LERTYPDFYQESPHNFLLDTAAAQGFPGAILLLATLALGAAAAWNIRTEQRNMAMFLGAALLAGSVSGFFTPPELVSKVYQQVTVAILCGVACANSGQRSHRTLVIPALGRWLAGLSVAAFAVLLLASDLRAQSFRRAIESHNAESAIARYRKVSEHSLPGFAIDLYASRQLAALSFGAGSEILKLRAWQEAIRAGQRAIRTAEDQPNAFFNFAQICALQNDATGTERNLRLAIQASPHWFKPHWILAQLLTRAGRREEALQQVQLALEESAGKYPEVIGTWKELHSPR
jgi:tetratricopeptide (TPR) repeat protein